MKKYVVFIVMIILSAMSGACAVVPALVTTGASMAVPQTASLVITAAGTVHKTVLYAADERDTQDIFADYMLTVQAQAMLLSEPEVDMDATCFNGDIYLVGDYTTVADRDRVISRLSELKGVSSVKGVVKERPTSLTAMVEPTITDNHAETVIETGLLGELHIKSANVDVEMVQGEAVIMGVVRDKEEAQHVIDVVKRLRPKSKREIKVTSLLAFQDVHDKGGVQENQMYALHAETPQTMVADATPKTAPAQAVQAPVATGDPSLNALYAHYFPKEPTLWQKSRQRMKTRILVMAKNEQNPRTKRELITLSSKVLKDKSTSIEDRLVRTLVSTSDPKMRKHVNRVLRDIAPKRTERIRALAMN